MVDNEEVQPPPIPDRCKYWGGGGGGQDGGGRGSMGVGGSRWYSLLYLIKLFITNGEGWRREEDFERRITYFALCFGGASINFV